MDGNWGILIMTKIQHCKGAADFLRVMWVKLYKPQCMRAPNKLSCLKETHFHFSEMAEAYAMHSKLSSRILNSCFSKPVNRILEEIALNYERTLKEASPDWSDEDLEMFRQSEEAWEEKYGNYAPDIYDDWEDY